MNEPIKDSVKSAAEKLCPTWLRDNTDPCPMVSLSASFGWAVWEAQRRLDRGGENDVWIAFIDTVALKEIRSPQQELFHAVELIDPKVDFAALCFASAFDEVLVWRSVPASTILGVMSFTQHRAHLPTYFYADPLQPYSTSNPLWGMFFTPKGFIQSHWELAFRISKDMQVTPRKHARKMLGLALRIAMRKEGEIVSKIATALGTWIIDWTPAELKKFQAR